MPTAATSARLLDAVDTIQAMAMRAMVWQVAARCRGDNRCTGRDIGRRGTHASSRHRRHGCGKWRSRRRSATSEGDCRWRSTTYGKQLDEALDLVADPAIAVGLFRRTDEGNMSRHCAATYPACPQPTAQPEAAAVQAARASCSHAALILLLLDCRRFRRSDADVLLPIVVTAIGRPVCALTRTMSEFAAGNLDSRGRRAPSSVTTSWATWPAPLLVVQGTHASG